MQEQDDIELLRRYVDQNSEEAFAALVKRHLNLVYSVALRHVHNPAYAEEITQAVFVILARKSGQIHRRVVLSGWLYHATRLTAANFLRSETQRARREQEAYMQSSVDEPEPNVWPQLAPVLDAAMAGLGERDRDAIVLRFFEGRKMHEVGLALGTNEAAAKKRVTRAVEKLRKFFTKRGVVVPAAVLTAAISANSIQAAPVALAQTTAVVALSKGATASASTLTLIKGALKLMAWTKAKTAIIVGGAVILAAGMTTTLIMQHQHRINAALTASNQTDFPRTSWAFVGYTTPENTAQSLFWAMRESNRNTFQAYLNGLSPELHDKMEKEAHRRGGNAFAELSAHEMGGVTRYRILKTVMLSDHQAQLQLQFGGLKGPVQTLAMEKIGTEWKFAGEVKN